MNTGERTGNVASMDGHPISAALYDRLNRHCETTIVPEHRRYLARNLDGTVLDLGVGTGAMFPYFDAVICDEDRLQLHGIEPDPYMKRRADERARKIGIPLDIRRERAESLPYDDETFDVIIASLVFCSIPERERALSEIHRTLKPGGEFRFLEHVRSDGRLGRFQDAIAPLWKRIDAGCRLNRRTGTLFEGSPLEVREIETLDIGTIPVKRLIRGTAVRSE